MRRVLKGLSLTLKPSARQKVVQKGAVSHSERTRGMPMVTLRSGHSGVQGYSAKSSSLRSSKRLATPAASWRTALSCSLTSLLEGSPSTSPRAQRLPVMKLVPFEKRMQLRLQWLAQKGQMRLASWV